MKKGFTLIELAMVLLVVGLLMGGGFQIMKVLQEKARATEAKQTLESAKEAVIAFAINNNGVLPSNQAAFNNLGFRGTGNTDINYISDGALQVCNSANTPLNTTDPNGVNTPNVAFILVDAGANMNVQTGRLTPADNHIRFYPWNFDSVNNAGVDEERTVLDRQTDRYDDFYVQVTLAELRSLAECQPLSIVNPSLHSWSVSGGPYAVQIIPQGGTAYTYALTAFPAGMTINAAGVINWPVPIAGTHNVTVRVNSGTRNTVRTYALVINTP